MIFPSGLGCTDLTTVPRGTHAYNSERKWGDRPPRGVAVCVLVLIPAAYGSRAMYGYPDLVYDLVLRVHDIRVCCAGMAVEVCYVCMYHVCITQVAISIWSVRFLVVEKTTHNFYFRYYFSEQGRK